MPLIHSNGKDCWSCYLLRAELSNALVFSLVFFFFISQFPPYFIFIFSLKEKEKKELSPGLFKFHHATRLTLLYYYFFLRLWSHYSFSLVKTDKKERNTTRCTARNVRCFDIINRNLKGGRRVVFRLFNAHLSDGHVFTLAADGVGFRRRRHHHHLLLLISYSVANKINSLLNYMRDRVNKRSWK